MEIPEMIPPGGDLDFSTKKLNRIALIDADRLKYLVTYNIHKSIENNEIYPSTLEELCQERLESIFNWFEADGYIFCFSGKSYNTFRFGAAISKEYKGNRKSNMLYEEQGDDMMKVVKYIQKLYPSLIYSDLEADDILSFLHKEFKEDTFIYSNDKDLIQIPGFHFDEDKNDLIEISDQDAFRNLLGQVLQGDTTDNIPGLPQFGKKKVGTVLEETPVKQLPQVALRLFQKKFGLVKGLDLFVESYSLVKLRENHGKYFRSRYQSAFDLVRSMLLEKGKESKKTSYHS